jgi:hypothetical protein
MIGSYGIKKPADVSPEDVEIILHYVKTREANEAVNMKRLVSTDILTPIYHNENTGGNADVELLGGLYNLKLDSSDFSAKGFYTLYLRPTQIRTRIADCGVLASLPSIRGIVVDISNVPAKYRNNFINNGLVGYRIEYLNNDGSKIPNMFRIVTSCFYCEPTVSNLTNTTQKAVRYRYVESQSNLIFCTLTPSSAPSNKPNAIPFIGQPNQNIIISNTFFNPSVIEIEMVEYDFDTLAYALYGNQTKSMEDGKYTIYDFEKNIYKQYNLFEIKDQFNNKLYEVREDVGDNVDTSKSFDDITDITT